MATTSGEVLVFDKLLSNVKRFHSGDWVLTGLVPAAPGRPLLSIWGTRLGFAASTADGALLFFEQSGQNLDEIEASAAGPAGGGGGGAGGEAQGRVAHPMTLEQVEKQRRLPYVLTKALAASGGRQQPIRSISLSPAEGTLACFVGGSDVGSAHMASLLLSNAGESPLELAGSGHHAGPILGMGLCYQMPLAVTCGADKFVRIWDYQASERGVGVRACACC